ncbi:hypothetical protein [Cohnella thailandensis]|uniref:Uncharacterized protein n=1 Tax=Cohnella thailandensis TaxID=557557 RepID=A0A841SYJ4_9BACL|nr:hypothetical protein [Cohnella thailandensis]MBB6635295.1 hypothetical protein [Cohnella thailandensis]MBP1974673.1 hypothetical protein [Cohnella thailandensis]
MSRFMQILLLSILFSILIGCSNINQSKDVVDDSLVINSISVGFGGDLNKTLVSYNFNLWNKTKKAIFIMTVEPILSDDLRKRLENSELINEINKTINGSSSEVISGSFSLNTQGLDKQGIEKLNIELKKFKIISEQEIGIETLISFVSESKKACTSHSIIFTHRSLKAPWSSKSDWQGRNVN